VLSGSALPFRSRALPAYKNSAKGHIDTASRHANGCSCQGSHRAAHAEMFVLVRARPEGDCTANLNRRRNRLRKVLRQHECRRRASASAPALCEAAGAWRGVQVTPTALRATSAAVMENHSAASAALYRLQPSSLRPGRPPGPAECSCALPFRTAEIKRPSLRLTG
jgi:hypothetical protein